MLLPPRPVLEFFPEYRSTQTPWQGLTPVAAWLIRDLRPGRLVELGSYRGDSFFAFLQAAAGLDEVKELVAIDSWEGDQHTGAYGNAVHDQFKAELTARGDGRARMLQSYFSDAAPQFENGSIDLLHIDGAHAYADVKADFDTWLPKMAPDGVVLFHDTMVRNDDFGVWQLWAEIERDHPGRTFNFEHSNGLGILCLGTREDGEIRGLCGLAPAQAALVRDAMRIAGTRVTDLTGYENELLSRNGAGLAIDHVFSRGEARESLERLCALERVQNLGRLQSTLEERIDRAGHYLLDEGARRLEARIEQLFREQTGDVFSALRPHLAEEQEMLRGALEDRIEKTGQYVLAESTRQSDARIQKLFREQTDDVFSALRPHLAEEQEMLRGALEDRIEKTGQYVLAESTRQSDAQSEVFESSMRQIDSRIEKLNHDREIKANAQDEAIIGMGKKLDAHEEAIQGMARTLQKISHHPAVRLLRKIRGSKGA